MARFKGRKSAPPASNTAGVLKGALQAAQTAIQSGKPAQAQKDLDKYTKPFGSHPRFKHIYGLSLLQQNKPGAAIPYLQEAAKAFPEDGLLHEHLGVSLLRAGKYAEAQEAFKVSLKTMADKPNLLTNVASAAMGLGQNELAEKLTKKALSLSQKIPAAWLLLAQMYYTQRRYDQVEENVQKALDLEPESLKGRELLGMVLLQKKEFQQAHDLYEKLVKDRGHMSDHSNFGVALQRLGRLEEAVAESRKGLEIFLETKGGNVEPEPKEFMSVEQAHQALKVTKHALDSLKIPFFLVAGTYLGIHRDGRLLPHDKDMDIGLPWATPRAQLLDAMKSFGFYCPAEQRVKEHGEGQWLITVAHVHTRITIDMFFAKREGEHIYLGFDHKPVPVQWKLRRFELKPIDYQGLELLVPWPPDQYFRDFYGPDWKTPQHYDVVLRGEALVDECKPISLCYGYNRLVDLLRRGNWKKAVAYCGQLGLMIDDDPLVDRARDIAAQCLSAEGLNPENAHLIVK